jgi:hypothetical protein
VKIPGYEYVRETFKEFAVNKLLNGYGAVFVPPLPANLQDLRNSITAAVALVDRDMLTRVWDEMDYSIDVRRITKGGYSEHL